ncbi:hypothetical protein [Phenylobacterium sp.]|uniref:hypothetical protein n=1 Tax=Phenylobacterium sp. TaxID=1871053 RepID=UPI002CDEA7CC|nr:hypothetical protein [Phenylobacterium sp.]HVI32474.1 hypothetical protein [Phenylobacterium sp.]
MRVLVALVGLGLLAAPGFAGGQPAPADRDPAGCRVGQALACPSLRAGVPPRMSVAAVERGRDWEALKARVDPLLAAGRCDEARAILVSEGRHALADKVEKVCKARG